ncbi:MAG TPA: hypothetical protein VG693_07045 [Actinomycetes bacterium]|nr:hypothetical protein [Actinomycetes bacterium]
MATTTSTWRSAPPRRSARSTPERTSRAAIRVTTRATVAASR